MLCHSKLNTSAWVAYLQFGMSSRDPAPAGAVQQLLLEAVVGPSLHRTAAASPLPSVIFSLGPLLLACCALQ